MKILFLTILISLLIISFVYAENATEAKETYTLEDIHKLIDELNRMPSSPKQETWGDIDYMWLWKPFETKKPFILYLEPSKTSRQVGEVKKDTILKLLDMKDGGWFLLREWEPPYRKGWVSGGSEEDDAVIDKVAPLCATLILSEEQLQSVNPYLYIRKDKMPFITVATDMIREVGKVNDRVIELTALGYEDVYFFEEEGLSRVTGKTVYTICVGTYKDGEEVKETERTLREKGDAKNAYRRSIADEYGGGDMSKFEGQPITPVAIITSPETEEENK